MVWVGGAQQAVAATVEGTLVSLPASGSVEGSFDSGVSYRNLTAALIRVNRTGGDFAEQLLPGGGANNPFDTFCTEPLVSITYAPYTFQVEDLEFAATPDIGAAKADDIRRVLYHEYPVFGASLTNTEAVAIQIAIWEIQSEPGLGPYSLTGGVVRFQNNAAAIGLAQGYLDDYVNTPSSSLLGGVVALTHDSQDLLAQFTESDPQPGCMKMRFRSDPAGWWGTARIKGTPGSGGDTLTLDTTPDDGGSLFELGAILNDGAFPDPNPCDGGNPNEQCFTASTTCTAPRVLGAVAPNPSPSYDLSNCNEGPGNDWQLTATTGGSGTITFTSYDSLTFTGTYNYTGDLGAHSGTYNLYACSADAVPVPEPPTWTLLLTPFAGLAAVRIARRRRRRSH
jgi:hypothetical protein